MDQRQPDGDERRPVEDGAFPPLLDGLRVLDFTRVLAGPFATAMLADLGADVIKVEPPHGDDYRAIGPMRNGESALFTVMNRNKKSIVLDLKQPAAIGLVHELAMHCDAVVENFRPGVADRLGVGYAALAAANPRLVYVSVSGFGQTGPYAHRPAYDIIVQAMSGLMEATGSPDGPPTLVGEAVSDVVTGIVASWALVAALLHRERTGRGQFVDVAMFDSMLSFLPTSVARFLFTGEPPRRVGNRHPLSAPFGIFRARDGHFALAVLNQKLFRVLVTLMNRPDLGDDTRFASDELRAAHEAALREAIEAWSQRLSVDEAVIALERAGIPAAPLWNIAQALASPQALARTVLRPIDDERMPGLRLPTQPVRFARSAANGVQPAPRLGQHTESVLGALLGCTERRIAELRAAGVFGSAPRAHDASDEGTR
jgi:CoA:oxalate CoA-transferase